MDNRRQKAAFPLIITAAHPSSFLWGLKVDTQLPGLPRVYLISAFKAVLSFKDLKVRAALPWPAGQCRAEGGCTSPPCSIPHSSRAPDSAYSSYWLQLQCSWLPRGSTVSYDAHPPFKEGGQSHYRAHIATTAVCRDEWRFVAVPRWQAARPVTKHSGQDRQGLGGRVFGASGRQHPSAPPGHTAWPHLLWVQSSVFMRWNSSHVQWSMVKVKI